MCETRSGTTLEVEVREAEEGICQVLCRFAGPFVTKMKRRVFTKRYLCLFTCPAIRAVHMDMAFSLSNTDSSMHLAKRWLPEENLEKLVVTMDQTLP